MSVKRAYKKVIFTLKQWNNKNIRKTAVSVMIRHVQACIRYFSCENHKENNIYTQQTPWPDYNNE